MSLTRNDRHEQQMLARLVEAFKNRPNVRAVIVAAAAQVQALEDANYELYSEMSIDTAVGVQLDMIGEIVGQLRLGFNDDDYRDWLAARILLNRSNGTGNDILTVADLVAIDALNNPTIELVEEYPAGYVVRLVDYNGNAQTIFDILRVAKPAGVSFLLEYTSQVTGATFTFSPTDEIESNPDRGFADAAETQGGRLVGAIR